MEKETSSVLIEAEDIKRYLTECYERKKGSLTENVMALIEMMSIAAEIGYREGYKTACAEKRIIAK